MEQPSGIPVRTSGIPRPSSSRLPVLRSSGSQSQLRSALSTEPLRKKPSLSSTARPSQPPPLLQRKLSRTSLVRSNTPSTAASTNSSSSRASLTAATKRPIPSSSQVRTSSFNGAAFRKPVGRPSSRQTKAAPHPTSSSGAREDDVLGDLDSFRSASRASSRASSRAGFRDNESEHALDDVEEVVTPAPRKSRPSLSERTIESLSQLPSSPASSKIRRRSSFFNADNSMPPPQRPASALSNGRRPTTSDGTPQAAPSTPRRMAPQTQRGSLTAPGKRSVSSTLATSASTTPSRTAFTPRPGSTIKKQPLSQMQNIQTMTQSRPLSNSKTMIARTPKSRPSIAETFGQAVSPPSAAVATTPSPVRRGPAVKTTPVTSRKFSGSSAVLREQITKAKVARKPDTVTTPNSTPTKTNTSQTLREQIAKAKEAARRAHAPLEHRTSTPPREAIVPDSAEIAGFDFGLEDPFDRRPMGSKSLLRKRIDGARVDGRLNIAAMGMSEIPEEVLAMYKYDPGDNTISWGEIVDLTVIIAADNEFQAIPDAMFPDVDFDSTVDSDEAGPQFGGVQTFDLHGNILRELPAGLRRLTQLSKLNLSRNELTFEALDVITQIRTLRDLKLAENKLDGALPSSIGNLDQLEILELQGNQLTSLPVEVRALAHLRTLNVSDNKMTTLPTELFTAVPVVELIASKNAFSGSFFNVDTAPHLQNLQLSNNSLTALCASDTIVFSALKTLNVSANRLSSLPDMTSWTSLTTLLVGENQLSSLPEGFLSLQQLRNADFTANNLKTLDPMIALMEGLENLTLAANPIRERKFLTMPTRDIKRDLLLRMEPEKVESATDVFGAINDDAATNGWKLTPSGTLDLSSENMTDIDEDAIASFAESNEIRQLYLQSNKLTIIPAITAHLSVLTVLDMSKNNIVNPLAENLAFPKLRELRLHGNKIRSFGDLHVFISAPKLQHLDLSNNSISGSLPVLRDFFPELSLLMASDNNITEVPAASLKGLKIVSLSNNDIERLEPQIGLHAGTLTSLDVEGNRFRVPNYAILKKGTDAILAWLRDKVPSPTEEFFTPGSPGF